MKKGYGIYCSLDCKYKSSRNGKYVECSICTKVVYRTQYRLALAKNKKYFCSKSCQTKWRNSEFVGTKHANWIDGKTTYKSLLGRHKIPKICTLCRTDDKRVLAVHHVNHDHGDNRLENLAWVCHNCHHLIHHDSVVRKKFSKAFAKQASYMVPIA